MSWFCHNHPKVPPQIPKLGILTDSADFAPLESSQNKVKCICTTFCTKHISSNNALQHEKVTWLNQEGQWGGKHAPMHTMGCTTWKPMDGNKLPVKIMTHNPLFLDCWNLHCDSSQCMITFDNHLIMYRRSNTVSQSYYWKSIKCISIERNELRFI